MSIPLTPRLSSSWNGFQCSDYSLFWTWEVDGVSPWTYLCKFTVNVVMSTTLGPQRRQFRYLSLRVKMTLKSEDLTEQTSLSLKVKSKDTWLIQRLNLGEGPSFLFFPLIILTRTFSLLIVCLSFLPQLRKFLPLMFYRMWGFYI